MTTKWADIQTHMRAKYQLSDDEPNMVSMVWTYDQGRTQKIVVRRFVAGETNMVEFKSAFAQRADVSPEVLLAANSKLPLATVALSGDVYLVVYNALLDNLQTSDLDFILSRVAAVADTLEEKYAKVDQF
ncbi:MAG: hypothetical protein GWP91_07295 [Rhodobacterales bacterium]|nr:hypothetical protein [Rhodobacterales bacterium]